MNDSISLPKSRASISLLLSLLAGGMWLAAACASGEPATDELGPPGVAGAAGMAGAAGTGNKGGSGGAAGKAGSAGSSGAGGQAGASGQAGAGGLQGTGGSSNPNCHLVINEVQVGTSSAASDEFAEIFNPCSSAVDLSDWKLVYRSASGSSDITLLALSALSIGPNGYLVLGGAEFSGTADATWSAGGLSATGGGLALHDDNGDTIDSLGWGSANNGLIEGGAAPDSPELGSSLARTPNGTDTDDNVADFQVDPSPSPGTAN